MQEFISEVNPLDEPVNEKRYTQSNVDTTGIDFSKPIDEPTFQPPPFKKNPNAGSSTSTFVDDKPKREREREPINPEMSNLSKKDTKAAAQAATKFTLQAYSWLHDWGNKALQVSDKKLNKLQASGEINLDAVIQYDYGTTIRAGEFFKEYNKQVSTVLKVSDEFKEEVTPLLDEFYQKRGIGLTLEQRLLFAFAKDGFSKALIVFQQRQQLNHMINVIKESTTSMQQPAPAPQPAPRFEERFEPEAPKFEKETIVVEPEEFEVDNTSVKVIENNDNKRKRGRPRKYEI